MCICIIIIIFTCHLVVKDLTISNKNINRDRVWVLGLGESDSRTERLQSLLGRGSQCQHLLQPETVKAISRFREICVGWPHDLPSVRGMPKKRTFSGGNSSQLLGRTEKWGVRVCNYLPIWKYSFSSCSLCGPQPRHGLLPEAAGRPGPRGFLIIDLCCDQGE